MYGLLLAVLLACDEDALLRTPGEPAAEAVDAGSRDAGAVRGPCRFVSAGQTLGFEQVEWWAETDGEGFVVELHETRRPRLPLLEADTFFGGPELVTGYFYDVEGRVERVERRQQSDDALWEVETLGYRDGSVAWHEARSGPAYAARWGQRYLLQESRWRRGDVELIDERRSVENVEGGARHGEQRWMALGTDGEVLERIDADDDGEPDHEVHHVRSPRADGGTVLVSRLVALEDPARVLAQRTTVYARDGRPLRQELDHAPDGHWRQTVQWFSWSPQALHAGVLGLDSRGSVASRHDSEWQRRGVGQRFLNSADQGADGALDWVQELRLFGGFLTMNNQIAQGATVVWNFPVQASCEGVEPRLEVPAFRPHCPLAAFSVCMLHDAALPYIPVP